MSAVTIAPLQLVGPAVATWGYWRRARTLSGRGAPVPAWRQWCWYSGVALIVVTLSSPVAIISDELFAVHMVEHLLIADLGALLLVLGLTGPMLAPVLRIRELRWLRALAHPAVALPLWAIDFYLWHLPALYQATLTNDWVHALEHLLFLACGMAIWMALLGPLPKPAWFGNLAKIVYIVLVRLIESVLANVLLWSGTVLYPQYAAGERKWGVTALQDQTAAGAIMMIEGSIVTIVLFGWLFLRAAQESEERDGLRELAASHGVELDERRAARAVAAGRGDALRERILAQAGAEPPAPRAE
jgi:cytochrome c oxidase assembly factor CtaG